MKRNLFIWRRHLRGGIVGLLVLLAAIAPARAGAALLYDAADGAVLYAEDADQPWYPASLTKMMTAYILFERWASGKSAPADKITISQYANSQPPSRLGLGKGKQLSLEDAVKALIIVSANDIAVAIAEALSGSEEAFIGEMNATAYRLGMFSTRFINPHGLPGEGQQTTAKDMARLAQALQRDFPAYLSVFSLAEAKIGPRRIVSHNSVLTNVLGGDGMKTGFTCSAGYNVVASASREGRRLVAVVLGEKSKKTRALRAQYLLEWGFARHGWKALFPTASVWSLPEGAFDRSAARQANLERRMDDCRDPVPAFILEAAENPAVAIAPAVVAGVAVSAAVRVAAPSDAAATRAPESAGKGSVKNSSQRKTRAKVKPKSASSQ